MDLKKGTSFTFKKADDIIVFVGKNKVKFKIKSVTDSGFISTNNVFFHKDSISMVRLGSSTSPAVYALGGFGVLFSFVFLASESDLIKSKSVEKILPVVLGASIGFYLYKIATGFKRNYKINDYRKLVYFDDVQGLPIK